ncbi:hypothetical protein BN938_0137 [Mucinivorans hirudinis]|uniref:Lipoprotein n=1 Tax=Mucinivorans hirudinis TaxID=1433126 RepID=A0A060RA05_9BACT|nr:hypothetical protein BN938_0137 [Mucinivorans hirudinis]
MKNLLLIIMAILCSCSPLKHVKRSEKIDSVAVDRSVAQQHTESTYRGEGVLTQTVVEFYHPMEVEVPIDKPIIPTTTDPVKQPVKRIIVTKIEAKAEAQQIKDSTVQNNIEVALTRESAEKVVEKPPAAVSWIKWAAIALGIILLIILAIKFL